MEEKIPINQTIPETDVHQAVTEPEKSVAMHNSCLMSSLSIYLSIYLYIYLSVAVAVAQTLQHLQ